MPQYLYPPPGFECPYRDACPYLDELSTTWVFGEYRRSYDVYQEHLRIYDDLQEALQAKGDRIRILERENAELKAKYQAIHQRQFKSNRKSKEQTEARNSETGKKKRGAPAGHPGWFRSKPERIDRTVVVAAPTHCPYCHGDKLSPLSETTEHVQEDMSPPPAPIVTRYVHHQAWCRDCGKVVSQAGEDETPGAHIGPLAKATAIYLRHDVGITYRKTQRIFKDLFGLSFVPASALGFDRKATSRGIPLYEDVRDKIRVSAVVHADETSWRNDGLGHFAWYAGNNNLAFFHIDRHRSAAVAQNIFGKDFHGVLVRDRYAAYNRIGQDWQACLAHVSRNAKDISKEHALLSPSDQDPNVDVFTAGIRRLCSQLCDIGQNRKSGKLPQKKVAAMEKRFSRNLNRICRTPLGFKPAESLRIYLIGSERKHLFTFLRHPGVPPTNNHAEQALRRLVIFRKISFGTRSQSGLKTHSVLPSLVLTAKLQGVGPMDFLRVLLTKDTATAQATLFHNTS
jgi:transposase